MNGAKLINVIEKSHYPFASYPRGRCETVLFAGCSLPSQFPRTTDALALRCREAGFGVVYDCCGQPLEGFGEKNRAKRVLDRLEGRLSKIGCKRLVLACPNCRAHLDGKLSCQVVGILDILDELELGGATDAPASDSAAQAGERVAGFVRFERGGLFIPCPDKRERAGEQALRRIADLADVETLGRAGCCGLRPDIAARGPQATAQACGRVLEQAGGETIYSYCASCLGQFARAGHGDCRHALSVLLGVDERPDIRHALANRAKRRFDRAVEPR